MGRFGYFNNLKHNKEKYKREVNNYIKSILKNRVSEYCKKNKLEIVKQYENDVGYDVVVKDKENEMKILSFRGSEKPDEKIKWQFMWSKNQQKFVNEIKEKHNVNKHLLLIYTRPKYKLELTQIKDLSNRKSF